jgi:PAS domain S-box-containing protein
MKTDEQKSTAQQLEQLELRCALLEKEAAELREKAALYEHVLNNTRDIVLVKDRQSRIVYANKAMCDLYGMTLQQMQGIVDAPFNKPQYTSRYLADDAHVMDNATTLVIPEEPVTRHDGLIRMFETIKSPILDENGHATLLVAVGRDITDRALLEEDRKRAERALDDAERLFRQMAESMRDVFWMATPDFANFLYVSPAYASMWGRPCKELLQDPMSFWQVVHPADRYEFMKKFEDLIKAGDGNFSHEFRIERRDGIRWLWVRTFPIWDDEGKLARVCGITHDITDRKEVERRVGEFNSMVSHELRTPLTSIRAALGLIEGGQAEPIGESTADLIRIARVECDRMIRLINDLLYIKKIEADKLELKIEDLRPVELVETVLSANRSVAVESGVQLKADVNGNDLFRGDRDRILQVMMNLLSNAIKFSPSGAEVLLSVSRNDGKIRFSITDHGPGIPEPEQHKLFNAFHQVDSSDSRAKGGTGLGLAISRAIVERHHGRIGFETRADQGSTFWFELPIYYASIESGS